MLGSGGCCNTLKDQEVHMFGRVFAPIVAVVIALVMTVPATATSLSSPVVPPSDAASLTGRNDSQWSELWWQYALSFPTSSNPLLSSTGNGCEGTQTSPTFFLVGSFVGPVTRTQCTVPANAYLFFPLISSVDINTTNQTAAELFAEIKAAENAAHDLHANIDGFAVPNLKTTYR